MRANLDLLDRKILSELDRNARTSYSNLAKKIRVAKETVKYRIESLLKKKIILGFYTSIEYSKLGLSGYRLYIRLQNTTPEKTQEIIQFIISLKNVLIVYRTSGKYNIVIGIYAEDQWECDKIITSIKISFYSFISSFHFSIFVNYTEFTRQYLLPRNEKIPFSTFTVTEKIKLDPIDLSLISLLSNNARLSLVDLAHKLTLSAVTVRYRLKNLIKQGVIIGFRPIFNLELLGYVYYKVDLFFNSYSKEFIQHVLSHPNVVYTEKTLLSSDFEFDLEVESYHHFISIMNSFLEKFPGVVKDYMYYSRITQDKVSYLPLEL